MKKLYFFIIVALLFLITFYSNPCTTMPGIITSVFAESKESSKNNPGKKSFKERMCSTITDFLEDKITTTKKGSNTSNILQGSLKEVNNLCGKGIVPQVSEIKGLSPKDKEILNKKTENALKKFYDGAGNLPDEDFDGIKLKSSKTSSGTSGTRLSGDKVSDLKSSDPTLPQASANPVPELKTAKAQSLPAVLSSNPQTTSSNFQEEEIWRGLIEIQKRSEEQACPVLKENLSRFKAEKDSLGKFYSKTKDRMQ